VCGGIGRPSKWLEGVSWEQRLSSTAARCSKFKDLPHTAHKGSSPMSAGELIHYTSWLASSRMTRNSLAKY